MKSSLIALAVISAVSLLSACHDVNRTTSVPRGTDRSAILHQEPTGLSAEPAKPDFEPPPANANTAAPGTDASVALSNRTGDLSETLPANDAHLAVQAEEAAVKAPDTASADAAKREVLARAASEPTGGAIEPGQDTRENRPRQGALTKEEESSQMPKSGQVNNHSSTELEKDSGR